MSDKGISIVIPMYNESRGVESSLSAVNRYFLQRNDGFEIIAVEDGSTDSTLQLGKEAGEGIGSLRIFSVIRNKGKGHAVRRGGVGIDQGVVLVADADLSTPREWDTRLTKLRLD